MGYQEYEEPVQIKASEETTAASQTIIDTTQIKDTSVI